MSEEFLLELDSITEITVLETMREELTKHADFTALTWQTRNLIYEKIQAIVCRIMQLELNEVTPIRSPFKATCSYRISKDKQGAFHCVL